MTEDREGVRMIMFAGPNGSGKSTTINQDRKQPNFPQTYINADDIARIELAKIPDLNERNLQAAQIAETRRREAIAEGKPFAFETVMSTPEKISLLTQARAKGYQVHVVFVTTEDADINVRRVAQRVQGGGHNVDTDKIRERYHRAMELMPHALDHAHKAAVYDNSVDDRMAIKVAEKMLRTQQLSLTVTPDEAPSWVAPKLVQPYYDIQKSRQEMQEAYKQFLTTHPHLQNTRIGDADASHLQRYQGEVLAVSNRHFLQQISPHVFAVHDRALYPKNVEAGKAADVVYAYQGGKFKDIQNQQAKTVEPILVDSKKRGR